MYIYFARLFFLLFIFNNSGSLGMYYDLRFCIFMGFLSILMIGPLSLHLFLGLLFFYAFAFFYSFVFALFYCTSFILSHLMPAFFLMQHRKGLCLYGMGVGEDLERAERRETIIMMYYVRKESVFNENLF